MTTKALPDPINLVFLHKLITPLYARDMVATNTHVVFSTNALFAYLTYVRVCHARFETPVH